jgi:uncharacterized membrane protein
MTKMITYYAVTFVAVLIAFAAIDSVWIGLVAAPLYKSTLGDAMLEKFRVVPAVVFYILQITGMMVFVVPGAAGGQGLGRTALLGALYGLFTYSTFDLTNYAILRNWTLVLAVSDIAWGCVLSAGATTAGVALAGAILKRAVLF